MSCWFLFLSCNLAPGKIVFLEGDDFTHLKALRLRPGDFIVLADGKGKAFRCRLLQLERQKAQAEILSELEGTGEPSLEVTLFAGLSKGEKMELIVRASVELGVKRIVPVLMERTVVRIAPAKGRERAVRWQKIAASAAAQCRRSFLPEVCSPLPFKEALELLEREDLVIVPWEEEKSRGIEEIAQSYPSLSSVSIFTGPEGGISSEEMAKLRKHPKVFPITLGPRILRAETAPLAALAVVMYLWGDLGGKK